MLQWTEISHCKSKLELGYNLLQQTMETTRCQNNVIHIQQQISRGGTMMQDKQRCITLGTTKTKLGQKGSEPQESCLRGLF
jgi:hypothetical protein